MTGRAFGPDLVESTEPLEVFGRAVIDLRSYISIGQVVEEVTRRE